MTTPDKGGWAVLGLHQHMSVLLCCNQYFTLQTKQKKYIAIQHTSMQSQSWFHTHPPNEAVTHGLSSCSKRGRGAEVIPLTTLTIAKIYIMLLVDEWNMNIKHPYNTTDRGNPKYFDKTLSQHHFVHHIFCAVYMKDVHDGSLGYKYQIRSH